MDCTYPISADPLPSAHSWSPRPSRCPVVTLPRARTAVRARVASPDRATRKRARAAEALAQVGHDLTRGLGPDVLAREITDRVRAVFGAQSVVLLRAEATGEALVSMALSGDAGPPEDRGGPPPGIGLASLAVRERRPVTTTDARRDPRVTVIPEGGDRLPRAPHPAGLAVPLLLQERILGVLAIADRAGRVFEPSEIRLAQAFGDQAAVTLEMARLYADARARQAEAETLAEEAGRKWRLLQTTLDHLSQGVSVCDADLRLVVWNTRFLDLLGFPREFGQIGRPMEDFIRYNAERGEYGPGDVDEQVTQRLALARRFEPHQFERVRPDGTAVEVRGMPLPGGGFVTTYTDVTDRRSREQALRRSEEQLRQAQKMEAVGRLAGGVAHDFNNLLTVITGRSEILLHRLEPAHPLRRHVDSIQQTAFRAADLIHQLLAFSRQQVRQPRVLDLNQVVVGAGEMLRRLIGEHIELVSRCDPALDRIKADPGQLEQVILNLVVNARDAMPKGGTLTIETANAELDEAFVRSHAGSVAGRYVRLTVADTGVGMDAKTLERVFEPFFTTKAPGRGTGLGLATVYGIVKQSDGYIAVESEPGRGSRFDVYLPREEAAAEPRPAVLARTGLPGGSETILLVEDQADVRELAREVLRMGGYTVLEAQHGREALDVSARYRGPIHLLLTDVVMPHMSGRELAERLTAARPGLRVLFMSGYTDDAIVHHGVLDPDAVLLPKPFTAEALTARLRELLDAGVPAGAAV